jgi:V/A-type H+-transporting ATPase subunit K
MKKFLAILMLSVIAMTFASAAWAQHEAPAAAQPAGTTEQAKGDIDYKVIFKAIGAALAIGFAAFATAWAQSKIGSAAAGAMAEKPEIGGLMIVLEALPETIIILGFVIAIMIVGMK